MSFNPFTEDGGHAILVVGQDLCVGSGGQMKDGHRAEKEGRKGVRKIFLTSPAVGVESGHGAAATHHGAGSCVSRSESACDASASVS